MPLCSVAALVTLFVTEGQSSAAQVLLNGTIESSAFGFTNFLDNTGPDTRAWSLRQDGAVLPAINSGGTQSTIVLESVPLAGGSDLSIAAGTGHAGLSGFLWTGLPDQAARDAMSNGSGFFSLSTIAIGPGAATAGTTYHVEILAMSAFAPDRRFDVSANGLARVDDWTIVPGSTFNSVIEFDVLADASGILLEFAPGSEGDTNPYIHAISLTAVPEPASTALLGLAGFGALLRRRR